MDARWMDSEFEPAPPERELLDSIKSGDAATVARLLDTGRVSLETFELLPYQLRETSTIPLLLACAESDLNMVKLLVERGANVDVRDEDGRTPLMESAYDDFLDKFEYLLSKGARGFTDFSGKSVLSGLGGALGIRGIKAMLTAGADCNAKGIDGWHVLPSARKLEHAAYLLNHGADVNATNEYGNTCMFNGTVQVLTLLVSYGANVNHSNHSGETALMHQSHSVEAVRFLLDHGARVDAKDKTGRTVLHWAAQCHSIDVVKHLADATNVDFNARDQHGNTALLLALKKYADEHVILCLIHGGTDVLLENSDGETALHIAAAGASMEVIKVLLTYIDVNHATLKRGSAMAQAVARYGEDRLEVVNCLLEHGAKPDVFNEKGLGPLQCAAQFRFGKETAAVIGKLLQGGADINHATKEKRTALMIASKTDDIEMITVLLDRGADIHAEDEEGKTALHHVYEAPVATLLLDRGALIDARDTNLMTPLMHATCKSSPALVQILITRGADPRAKDKVGATALHHAAQYARKHEIVGLLIAVSDLRATDNQGATPLLWAARGDLTASLLILLDSGASLDTRTKSGSTMLHEACGAGKTAMVKLLVERGALIDTADNAGVHPIERALQGDHVDVVYFLLEHGACRGLPFGHFFNWISVLCWAASRNRLDIVQSIIRNELIPLVRLVQREIKMGYADDTYSINSPLAWAVHVGSLAMTEYLLERGSPVNIRCPFSAPNNIVWHRGVQDDTDFVFTLLERKCNEGALDFVQLLVRFGADMNSGDFKPLMEAVANNHLSIVTFLLANGAEINAVDEHGDSALHIAAARGHFAITRELLDWGASRSLKNSVDRTPDVGSFAIHTMKVPADLIRTYVANPRPRRLGPRLHDNATVISALRDNLQTTYEEVLARRGECHRATRALESTTKERDVLAAEVAVRRVASAEQKKQQRALANLQRKLGDRDLILADFTDLTAIGQSTNQRRNYGVNSLVYEGAHPASAQRLVLKVLLNPYGTQANESIQLETLFGREYNMPCNPHTCLMPVLQCFKDSPVHLPGWPARAPDDINGPIRTLFVVLPRYDGALQTVARQRREQGHVSERWLLSVLCPVLLGVQHMVQHNVLHMDLKLDNVLVRNAAYEAAAEGGVSPNLEVVLADFGCLLEISNIESVSSEAMQNREGNPSHRAPEFRTRAAATDLSKAEVWSVGVLVHELVNAVFPFGDQAPVTYALGPQHELPRAAEWPLLGRLVRAMLPSAPRDRIGVDEAVLLAQALLYGAPREALTDADEMAELNLKRWRDERVLTLHRAATPNEGGATGHALQQQNVAWLPEVEYMCDLDVHMLCASAKRWLHE